MTTKKHEGVREEANVGLLVANLQGNMRLYDSLQPEISSMRFDVMAADAVLADLDLEKMYLEGNSMIALAALHKLVIDRKMAELQKREATLQYSAGDRIVIENRGELFHLKALNPQKQKIAKFWIGNGSEFSGKEHIEQTGRLYQIGLQASDGGFIKLANKRKSQMYQAGPLFDRQDDYRPLFEIKYLDSE